MSQGTVGRRVRVATNSFEIKRLPAKPYYHYDVIMKKDPKGDKPCPRHRCKEIVEKMQDNHPQIFNPRASYDGYKNLFCSKKFDDGTYTVRTSPNPNRGVYEVKLTNVSTIHTSDLARLISAAPAADPLAPQNTIPVTLLQVIISQAPHIAHDFSLHAKSFYVARNAFDLSGGIQGWRGFFQSVRPVIGRFIVNVDTTAAAFYMPGDLINAAASVLRADSKRMLIHLMITNQDAFEKVRKFFKGVVVTIRPSGIRKKITNIVPRAGRQEFDKDGSIMTVAEYWAEHHRIILEQPDAFGVQVGYDEAIFPAEMCSIVSGQRYKKKLSPEDTAAFILQTKSGPAKRLQDITQAVAGRPLDYGRSLWMADAQMEVSTQPMQVNARQLPPPRVMYGGGFSMNVDGGAWNVMHKRLIRPARIERWGVVMFEAGPDAKKKVEDFVAALKYNMGALGIQFADALPVSVYQGNPYNVDDSMNVGAKIAIDGLPLLPNGHMHKPSFMLAVLPRDALEIRRQIKQWGDMRNGIPTQCIRQGKYDKPQGRDQYCNNVALKINAKVGGINSFADPPTVAALIKGAMFVGCDVTHPAPGVTNRPSVASLVSSTDVTATRYHVFAAAQLPRQEIISDIAFMMQNAVAAFGKARQMLPQAVVIYRDGVSESEYEKVEQEEIKPIEELFRKKFENRIQLVFIVVGKRHHVRFFPLDRSQADRTGNCMPGLVVDTEIVHSRYMDFYLQSHAGLIGTSRPSHYVVLRNGPRATADQLQELSFALCHVYAPATRSVSIPAPVYYADRVCTRVSEMQFIPKLYEDDGSTDTGERDVPPPPFPLDKWKQGLGISKLAGQMYFL